MKTASFDGKWKGEVIFHDPLSIQQEADWELAMSRLVKAQNEGGGVSTLTVALLPGIVSCVAEFKLKDFPEKPTLENFPKGLKKERAELLSWFIEEIQKIYLEKEPDPNEL